MLLTRANFLGSLLRAVPEAAGIAEEHVHDFDGDVPLHLLVADVRRLVLTARTRGDGELTARCLTFLAQAFEGGDDEVQNAVAASFVEDSGWWDEFVHPFSSRELRRRGAPGTRSPGSTGGCSAGRAVHLRVLALPDQDPPRSDAEGELVFETRRPLLTVARAVARGAEEVLATHGEEEYLRRWVDDPFPSDLLQVVQDRIDGVQVPSRPASAGGRRRRGHP